MFCHSFQHPVYSQTFLEVRKIKKNTCFYEDATTLSKLTLSITITITMSLSLTALTVTILKVECC